MTSAFVGQFIYLIQEREFVNSGENVFKVGRSSQLINRISSYPKGSNVIFAVKVSDAVIAETSVLQKPRNSNDVKGGLHQGGSRGPGGYGPGHQCKARMM